MAAVQRGRVGTRRRAGMRPPPYGVGVVVVATWVMAPGARVGNR
jgi:hypothetical protein